MPLYTWLICWPWADCSQTMCKLGTAGCDYRPLLHSCILVQLLSRMQTVRRSPKQSLITLDCLTIVGEDARSVLMCATSVKDHQSLTHGQYNIFVSFKGTTLRINFHILCFVTHHEIYNVAQADNVWEGNYKQYVSGMQRVWNGFSMVLEHPNDLWPCHLISGC